MQACGACDRGSIPREGTIHQIDRPRGRFFAGQQGTSLWYYSGDCMQEQEYQEALTRDRASYRRTRDERMAADLIYTAQRARQIYNEAGETFEEEDIHKLVTDKPTNPTFPFIMMTVAVLKDIIDIPGELSAIAIVLTTLLSALLSLILSIWTYNRMSGGWWKKRIIRTIWKRWLIATLIEISPWGKMIPANTIFIWMANNSEKKIVKLANLALEEFHKTESFKNI